MTAAAIVMVAEITSSTDFHVIDLGSAGAGGGGLTLGQGPRPPLTGLRISPDSEAATQLVADAGLATFEDARLDALFDAVDASTDDAGFADLSPEAAAALAFDLASDDPTVQAIPNGPTATPTPTPTAIPAVEWIAADGRWGDAANWSSGATPGPDDVVRIAANGAPTITHDEGTTVVGSLIVEDGLVVSGGSVTVRGSSVISGTLTCSSALAAEGTGVLLDVAGTADLDGCSLAARGGARVRVPGVTSYDAHPDQSTIQRTWEASGSGSTIELPNLTSMRATGGAVPRFSIEAIAGGAIEIGNATLNEGGFAILAGGTGSRVDLSSTTTIPMGSVTVRAGGQVLAPEVAALDGVELVIQGGTSSVLLPQLTALTRGRLIAIASSPTFDSLATLDGSDLEVTGGTLTLPAVVAFIGDPDGVGRQARWSAAGAGSMIQLANLSQVTGVSVGVASRFVISAVAGGRIELAKLAMIPSGHVSLSAAGVDSRLEVPQLTGVPSGSVLNATDGGVLESPLITSLDGVTVTLRGTGTLPLAQLTALTRGEVVVSNASATFAALAALDGTSLQAVGGASIALPGVEGFVADPDEAGRQPRWVANGPGSTILVSNLVQAVGVEVGVASRFFMTAEDGGSLSVPALAAIPSGHVALSADGSGSIVDCPELGNVPSGSQISAANGGTVSIPMITQLDGVTLMLTGDGALPSGQFTQFTRGEIGVTGTSAVFDALIEMNGTTLRAAGGASIALPAVQAFVADPDSAARQPLWEADGANSVISVPQLNFVAGVSIGAASRFNVHAVRGGRVTLSGLDLVQSGRVQFLAENPDSVLDLSALTQFDPLQVSIEELDGGTVLRPLS